MTHYSGKAQVAGIDISDSMQIEHEAVESAGPGDQIGVQVGECPRVHDKVYRVLPD